MASLSIGIDYRPALSRSTGVGRYVSGLVGALARIDRQNAYVLFSSSFRERATAGALPSNFELMDRRIPVSLLNTLWHRLELPSLDVLAGRSFDISHSPHPLILPTRGRTVVTIHDIFFYRHADATRGEVRRDYAPLVKAHAARADAIVTGSRATKEELVRDLGVTEEKIQLTPYGIDPEGFLARPDEEQTAAAYQLPSAYVLSVATLEPRKNLPLLVEAVGQLVRQGWEGSLLIAGGPGIDEEEIDRAIDRAQLDTRVRKLGYVPPQHLPTLYRRARVLASVSLCEGFGFPVLEAMACGVPVVASDIPTHREVAEKAAVYVEPLRPESIASGIARAWSDDDLRYRLVQHGSQRVKLFSWDETARKTLAIYQRLASQ